MGFLSSVVHAVGNVAAPVEEAAGGVMSLGGLVPNKYAAAATNAGHAISNQNVQLTNPGALLSSAPAFTYTGGQTSQAKQIPQAGGGGGGGGSTYYDSSGNAYTLDSSGNPVSGGYTGGSGGGSAQPDYSAQIASIDSQTHGLQGNLGYADTQLQQGLQGLQSQYNQQASAANLNHSNALQNFQTTQQNDNTSHGQAIDQVNTKARTLANSVRQMLGNAAGSGSSAYQITAPGAVQRQADLQSQNINTNFGQNMTALDHSKTQEKNAYDLLNTTLNDKLTQGRNGLQTSIDQQKQQINNSLSDLAAQRAAYLGGGVKGAQAAAAPFQANADANQQAIDNIAKSYSSPFQNVAPVNVAAPTLRDYVTGQTQVATNPDGTQTTASPTYNPLASWLQKNQDQNQYSF